MNRIRVPLVSPVPLPLAHARVALIGAADGLPSVAACGAHDVLPMRLVDPWPFAFHGMDGYNARAGYCSECAAVVVALSDMVRAQHLIDGLPDPVATK